MSGREDTKTYLDESKISEYPDTEQFQDGGMKVKFYIQTQLWRQRCCFAISLEDAGVIVYSKGAWSDNRLSSMSEDRESFLAF